MRNNYYTLAPAQKMTESLLSMKAKFLSLAASLLLVGCSQAEEAVAPQAIPVRTVIVATQTVPNVIELPGRVEPVREAEVRARVTGIVQELSLIHI